MSISESPEPLLANANHKVGEARTVQDLAKLVQGTRTGTRAEAGVIAMSELITKWSPVGRNIAELKAMFGEPSEEDDSKMIYRFDDGLNGCQWTLGKDGNAIMSVAKLSY